MKLLFSLVQTTVFFLILLFGSSAFAHFQCLIPSDDMIMAGDSKDLQLDLIFMHPFEGHYMEMVKPVAFGVKVRGRTEDLRGTLTMRKLGGFSAWQTNYRIKRPGDYVFYVEPAPYFEPAEQSFIIQYTKTVVHAFGLEEGWDEEIGLKTEIIPLTRPYGIGDGQRVSGHCESFRKARPLCRGRGRVLRRGRYRTTWRPLRHAGHTGRSERCVHLRMSKGGLVGLCRTQQGQEENPAQRRERVPR